MQSATVTQQPVARSGTQSDTMPIKGKAAEAIQALDGVYQQLDRFVHYGTDAPQWENLLNQFGGALIDLRTVHARDKP